ncbi:MAG: GTPase Era [Candidatus Shapirobacteria bacterium]|jgi:GTP-binding protein Era
MKSNKRTKFGKAVIVGRPNTGKSTLLNAIMNQKVAITSPLPQTTRKNIEVEYNDERGKIKFTDTPGMMAQVKDLMSKRINQEPGKQARLADVIVMVVDISRPKSEEENKSIGLIRKLKCKKILVYNKIDKAIGSKDHLGDYNYLEEEFDKVIDVSAIKGKNVKGLINLIFELLPYGKVETEENAKPKPVISMSSTEFVEEIIREKCYLFLRDEVPYNTTVKVGEIKDKKKLIYVKATIKTTADKYKKMIIGDKGRKIKEIGYNARKELELMSQRKIYLELQVETDKHWQEVEIEK